MLLTQDRGGPVDVAVPLAAQLAAAGVPVRLFGPRPARGAERVDGLWEQAEIPGKASVGAIRAVRARIRAWRPDVVHAQDRRAGLAAVGLGRVVHTYHGVPEDVGQRWFAEGTGPRPSRYTLATLAADAAVARLVHHTVVPAPAMGAFLAERLRVPQRRIVHIDNGLVLPGRAAARPGPVRKLLFVGLLIPRKGLADLLAAMAVPGVMPADAELTVVGDGPERAAVERLAAPFGGRVRMLGFRTDVPELMAGADAVVVPSRMEQQPLVVVEAMAAAKPVLATACGDVPRMLGPGTPLAAPGAVGSLAAALRNLFDLADPDRVGSTLADRAARMFDVTASAAAHVALYRRLVSAASTRSPDVPTS